MVAVAIFSVGLYLQSSHAIKSEVDRRLLYTATHIKNMVGAEIEQVKGDMLTLLANKSLEEYFMYLNIGETDYVEDARATLEENFLKIAAAKPQYPTLRIFRSDGKGIVNITDKRATHKYPDPTKTIWFNSAIDLAEGNSFVSGIHKCPEHKLPSIFVSQPYYYRGHLLAIGALHLHLQEFMGTILKDIEIGKSGFAYAVNDQGIIVAHKDSSRLGTDLSHLTSVQSVVQGDKGTLIESDGTGEVRMKKSFLPLTIQSAGIVVAQPLKEAMAVSTSVKWYIAGIASVVAGFLVLLIFLTSRKIVIGPVRELSAATQKLLVGDLSARVNLGKKLNCWQLKNCDQTHCPAYGDVIRSCWLIPETECPTCEQGQYVKKIEKCQQCEVFISTSCDEIETLAETFNLMAFTLNEHITGLKDTEKRLREQRRLFQTILDATPDFVSLQGRQLVYRAVNRAFCKIIGRKEDQISGKTVFDVFPRQKAEIYHREDIAIMETGDSLVKENKINRRTGKKWLHVVKLPVFDADGEIDGLLCSGRDITQLKRVQEQLTQAQKMESIGQLIAGIAHEINTPVGIILGYSQLLLEEMDSRNQNYQDLKIIEKQAKICRTVVSDLLRFSRRTESTLDSVNLNEAIEEVLSVVEHTFKLEHVTIVRDFDSHLPEIMGDTEKLKQAIINLVNNAFDAINSGGNITVSTHHDRQADEVIIRIADTGSGISPEIIDKIFDPFFTTKPVDKGTGLGLSVTFGIIQEHGGKIEVESPPLTLISNQLDDNQGTEFIIRLPIQTNKKLKDLKDGQDTRIG